MKIRTKINVSFLTVFILVVSLVGLVVGIYTINLVKNNIFSYLRSGNRARAEHIRTFLQDQKDSTRILAGTLSVENYLKLTNTDAAYVPDREALGNCFEKTIENNAHIYEIFVLDIHGKIVVTTDKSRLGLDKSDDSYFIGGKSDTYIKDIYYSEPIKKINYTISSPVRDDETGTILGVLVVRYNPENLYSAVQSENGLGKTEENFLVNKDKFFITPSQILGESVILNQKVKTENVDKCFNPKEIEYVNKNGYGGIAETMGNTVVEANDYRNVDVMATHSYIPETGWCLITKVDTVDLMSFRTTMILIFLSIFTSGGLIYLLVGLLISKKITDPILALTTGAQKVKEGNFDYKTNISTKDEIGMLSRTFDKMTEVVNESYSNIEKKVEEQTKELSVKAKNLEEQKRALLNIAEDAEKEKQRTIGEKNKIDAIVHSIGDGVFVVDKDLKVILVNKVAAKMSGFTMEEILGVKYTDKLKFIFEDTGKINDQFINQAIETKVIQEMSNHTVLIDRTGNKIQVADSAAPLLDSGGDVVGCVVVFRDVTKERSIDKAKTEFVSLASHQLRTPLSAVNWYAEMLLAGDAGRMKPEQAQYLEVIYHSNQRMVELVNSLLNVSRLELGTLAVESKLADITKIADRVINDLGHEIFKKKQTFEKKYDKNLKPMMLDEKLVGMIFQNLLSNAIKYTPEKGKIMLEIKIKGKMLEIAVADNGIGIPAAQQDKIFTKLFRADNVRVIDTEGTGLGLYLVKLIVECIGGGKVWFSSPGGSQPKADQPLAGAKNLGGESPKNPGSTFYVTLPIMS